MRKKSPKSMVISPAETVPSAPASTRPHGRSAMTRRSVVAVAVGVAMLTGVGVSLMSAQQPPPPVNDKPLTEKWAPTEWGANDKVGAPNRTTPAMVLKALRLVKQGKVA